MKKFWKNIARKSLLRNELRELAGQFQIPGEFLDGVPYGSGHINDTYAITFRQEGKKTRYILQRINHNIFKDPPAVMENIIRVTQHIRDKIQAQDADNVLRRVLTVIPTSKGESYHIDDSGDYWRAYIFIENATTYDTLQSPEQAYEAAKTFGEFQKTLIDLPSPPLKETILNFHSGPVRYQAFQRALEANSYNRAANAEKEISFLQSHSWIFDVIPEKVARGEMPVRTTHNDTKINNVMLDDETGEGVCVIDLDTVMPGSVLYDFGDLVRTVTSPTHEDELDLSKVKMHMHMFEKLARGYLAGAGDFLSESERSHLAFAGKLITLIIGTRFLTDYLEGDVYFKYRRDGHNLDRCRTQFKLVQSIIEQEEEMMKFVISSNQRKPS